MPRFLRLSLFSLLLWTLCLGIAWPLSPSDHGKPMLLGCCLVMPREREAHQLRGPVEAVWTYEAAQAVEGWGEEHLVDVVWFDRDGRETVHVVDFSAEDPTAELTAYLYRYEELNHELQRIDLARVPRTELEASGFDPATIAPDPTLYADLHWIEFEGPEGGMGFYLDFYAPNEDGQEPSLQFSADWDLDAEDRMERLFAPAAPGEPPDVTTFEYDATGRLIKRVMTPAQEGGCVDTREYEYNEAGQLVVEHIREECDPEFALSEPGDPTAMRAHFAYNTQGDVIEIRYEPLDGAGYPPFAQAATYEYDAQGNWVVQEGTLGGGSLFAEAQPTRKRRVLTYFAE